MFVPALLHQTVILSPDLSGRRTLRLVLPLAAHQEKVKRKRQLLRPPSGGLRMADKKNGIIDSLAAGRPPFRDWDRCRNK